MENQMEENQTVEVIDLQRLINLESLILGLDSKIRVLEMKVSNLLEQGLTK